jgi:hypothetical protein
VELQIEGRCAQGQDEINFPTPMELQSDTERLEGQIDIKISRPMEF